MVVSVPGHFSPGMFLDQVILVEGSFRPGLFRSRVILGPRSFWSRGHFDPRLFRYWVFSVMGHFILSIYLLILSRSISDHHLRCGVGG